MKNFLGILLLAAPQAREQEIEPSGRMRIDRDIRRGLSDLGMEPSPRCDDAEFLRRAFLDVAGTIPTPDRARRFLEDPSPDKRDRLIEELLYSEDYSRNWADVWASAILGVGDVRFQESVAAALPVTLEPLIALNLPLNEFARRVVLYESREEVWDGLGLFYYETLIRAGQEFPQAFAGKFSRVFLGRQIHCARCHDHPFDRWTQQDFYGMAAFFSGVKHERFGVVERPRDETFPLKIPGSKEPPVRPAFLDTREGPLPGERLRDAFARILTDPSNDQFGRALVNRYWSHFFGRGLVHPVDGFSAAARPSHPELLDGLARDFRVPGYDARWLIREICRSEAYQRSARSGDGDRRVERERACAKAAVRVLRPEQLLNALLTASGRPVWERGKRPEAALLELRRVYGYGQGDGGFKFTGGVPSALLMLNGTLTAGDRPPPRLVEILGRLQDPEERIREIFLATLSRFPRPEELRRHREYASTAGDAGYGDLFAALLNSAEFLFNR